MINTRIRQGQKMHHSVDQDVALLYGKVHLENKNNGKVVW